MINKNKDENSDNFDDIDFDNDMVDPDYDADFDEDESFENDLDSEQFEKAKSKPRSEKKSLSFNTMVIVGAVVLGGGVLVFNVMNQTAKQAESVGETFVSPMGISDVMDGGLSTPKPETPKETPIEVPTESNQGFLSGNSDAVPKDSPKTENIPQPSPIVPQDNTAIVTPLPNMAASDAPLEKDNSGDAKAISAENLLKTAIENRNKPNEEKTAENNPEFPAPSSPDERPAIQKQETAVPVLSETKEDVQPKLSSDMSEKLDQILIRMDNIENEIGNIQSDASKKYDDLDQKLSVLKNDMAAIENKPVVQEASEKQSQPVKVVKKAPVKKKSPPQTAKTKESSNFGVWELRAAQPGRAWISKSGEKDMQSVEVGKTIEGIGQVRAITYQNGRWTVLGSQGQISQ